MNETVDKLKLYLPFGKFITFKKHMLYFEAGLGLNQVLSIIDDFKLNVRINKTNIPIAEIEKRISNYSGFSTDFNSRVFVRMSSGINFKIFKKLFLNTSVLLETNYFGEVEELNSAPGISRITRFAIYPGFSVGLMYKQ